MKHQEAPHTTTDTIIASCFVFIFGLITYGSGSAFISRVTEDAYSLSAYPLLVISAIFGSSALLVALMTISSFIKGK